MRNGDRWVVTATDHDGSMTVQRAIGAGMVVLPAAYVSEHVELAYASSAHRAQGRTVDTAHALVSPTTTREVLYVWPPGAGSPTGSTSTPTTTLIPDLPRPGTEPATANEVLAGVLRNEGADVAAHEMIRAPAGRGRGHGAALGRVPDPGHACPSRSAGTPCSLSRG